MSKAELRDYRDRLMDFIKADSNEFAHEVKGNAYSHETCKYKSFKGVGIFTVELTNEKKRMIHQEIKWVDAMLGNKTRIAVDQYRIVENYL